MKSQLERLTISSSATFAPSEKQDESSSRNQLDAGEAGRPVPVEEAQQSKEELEEKIDHLSVLIKWIDGEFEDTYVPSPILFPSASYRAYICRSQ
jgi:hypothetical protein